MPTAHRLSFPTCISHPRSIHLLCHSRQSIGCFTSLTLGFSNRPDQNSQSSIAATGPLPGDLTSSTHSLTWREFPTGLTTCFFNHNHLPHLERVLYTGLTTYFFNSIPTPEDNNKAQQGTNNGDKPHSAKGLRDHNNP
jgi:hypothetical protein